MTKATELNAEQARRANEHRDLWIDLFEDARTTDQEAMAQSVLETLESLRSDDLDAKISTWRAIHHAQRDERTIEAVIAALVLRILIHVCGTTPRDAVGTLADDLGKSFAQVRDAAGTLDKVELRRVARALMYGLDGEEPVASADLEVAYAPGVPRNLAYLLPSSSSVFGLALTLDCTVEHAQGLLASAEPLRGSELERLVFHYGIDCSRIRGLR